MPFRRERLRVDTLHHTIEGILQLPTEGYRSRTTDYLNAHDSDFIALTEATIAPRDGGPTEKREFVAVNLRHAVLVIELESLGIVDGPVSLPGLTIVTESEPPPDPLTSVPPPNDAS